MKVIRKRSSSKVCFGDEYNGGGVYLDKKALISSSIEFD
jgi:hypothetical protein